MDPALVAPTPNPFRLSELTRGQVSCGQGPDASKGKDKVQGRLWVMEWPAFHLLQ